MAKFRTVGRIISGPAGADRKVIQPNTEFASAADVGLSEEEFADMVRAGAIREVPEDQPAAADGPTPATPAAGATADPAAAAAESETISRDAPTSGTRPARGSAGGSAG